jgi:hypothetical protein
MNDESFVEKLKRIAKEKEEPNFKKYIHEQKIETS